MALKEIRNSKLSLGSMDLCHVVSGSQVCSVVSIHAFHLCGPQFEPRQEPCMWIGFFSPNLAVCVFSIGVFLPRLKLKFLHCLLYKQLM